MLFVRGKPYHVAWADLFDRASFALRPAYACDHNECLPKGMRMPCGACTGFESDGSSGGASVAIGLKQRIDANGA